MNYIYKQLLNSDVKLLKDLLKVFGEAFNDLDTYQSAVPSDGYLSSLLSKPHFIALVALNGNKVIGGLTAYELEKFEQDRREIYIYDLAVATNYRRKGLATGLIKKLIDIAKQRKVNIIYVQADKADAPAIALYENLGIKEDVYHFNIHVE